MGFVPTQKPAVVVRRGCDGLFHGRWAVGNGLDPEQSIAAAFLLV